MKVRKQQIRKLSALSKTDGHCCLDMCYMQSKVLCFNGSFEICIQQIMVLTQKSFFETERQTFWLMEAMYAIKKDLIESQEVACKKIKDLNQEIGKLSAFMPFQDRRTLWLIEGLFSIKRDVLWFIVSQENCMQKNNLTQEMMKKF